MDEIIGKWFSFKISGDEESELGLDNDLLAKRRARLRGNLVGKLLTKTLR